MLTLCVLNYNGAGILRRCLDSVQAQSHQPDKVYVIDNDSTDDSWRIAKDYGYEVIHTDNKHRLITGLNKAHGLTEDWLFFMSNDVVLRKHCIERMMAKTPLWCISQPVFYDQYGEIDNAGMDIRWPGLGMGRRTHWWKNEGATYCGMVSDIAFLVNRLVIDKVGMYDTLFSPGYYEDVDWAIRSKYEGVGHVLIPDARAIHHANYSYSKVMDKAALSKLCRENRKKLIRKHYRGLNRLLRLGACKVHETISLG